MKVTNWVAIQCPEPDCNAEFYKAKPLAQHKLVKHGIPSFQFNREVIDDAVKCPNWQKLRIMMKGLSTQDKISLVQSYFDGRAGGTICCTTSTRLVQVLNYLNALSRGGQIEALSRDEKASLIFDETVQVRIRR